MKRPDPGPNLKIDFLGLVDIYFDEGNTTVYSVFLGSADRKLIAVNMFLKNAHFLFRAH